MKNKFLSAAGILAALLSAGCGHLSLDTAGNPDRVLIGTVEFSDKVVLPPDTGGPRQRGRPDAAQSRHAGPGDLGHAARPSTGKRRRRPRPGRKCWGSRRSGTRDRPRLAFHVEYTADDDRLRHGLAIEVRVSYGGTVRFFNATQYAVSLNDVSDLHQVWVEPSH